jgi:hypothetical protein
LFEVTVEPAEKDVLRLFIYLGHVKWSRTEKLRSGQERMRTSWWTLGNRNTYSLESYRQVLLYQDILVVRSLFRSEIRECLINR